MTERLGGGLAVAVLLALVGCTLTVPATPTPDHTPLTTANHTPLPTSDHTPLPTVTHATSTPTPLQGPAGWPMFHADEKHSGNVAGVAHIPDATGPRVIAQYRMFDQPASAADMAYVRWTSTLPLADINGDGRLDIVVTTPDAGGGVLARLGGEPIPNAVKALTFAPGGLLRELWTYTLTSAPGEAGLDTYSPAIADADGDGLPDVIFTSRDDFVRALKGTDGSLIWQFNMGRITEAGPMLADLDGDGTPEVIVASDCGSGTVTCGAGDGQAQLYVLPSRGSGDIQPLWSLPYPYKMDSAVPVIATIDGLGKVIVAGTWGGQLLAVWRTADGQVRNSALDVASLDPSVPAGEKPVIRTSPLAINVEGGPLVVFGWLPTDLNVQDARLTAKLLTAQDGAAAFTAGWTISGYDTWKSSPAVAYNASGNAVIEVGYGLGIGPPPSQSGSVGSCDSRWVFGGFAAFTPAGVPAWPKRDLPGEGNIRASAAVADMNGDGSPDVILPVGCYGKVYAYDAITGNPEWSKQLGPISQGSPSLGDIDGDGELDIVLSSYDGQVWVLGK